MARPLAQLPTRPDWRLTLVAGALLLVWNMVSWRFPFFWDTVLNSKIAHWYLETGFSQLTVPEDLDAGHPPFFSLYIALVWQVFGRSLAVAHMAMLPILGILLWQYQRLASRWLSSKGCIWAVAILCCEPTFLAQSSMVTPDIALVAFYLLALNSLLDGRPWWAAGAMALLASMSFRGILMVPALFVTTVLIDWGADGRRPGLRSLAPFLPVAGLTLLWFWLHHRAVGWLFSPPPETYGGQRQLLGLAGMARNTALIAWRVMDFGRIFLWGLAICGAVVVGLRRVWQDQALKSMSIALLAPLLLLSALFIPFSNPPGHRYYLVAYAILGLLVIGLVELDGWRLRGKLALAAVCLGMATGHCWVYPTGIAQGWDGSLAHVPGFALEREMNAFIATQGLQPSDVCGDFPQLHNHYYTYVQPTNSDQQLRNFLEEQDCHWALVTRLNNGYTEVQHADFETSGNWVLRKGIAWGPIFMRLYEHR